MFKKWKKALAGVLVLACAAETALAQKLPFDPVSRPKPAIDLLGTQPGDIAPSLMSSDAGIDDRPASPGAVADAPLLTSASMEQQTSGTMEQLPMPGNVAAGEAPVFFSSDDSNGNGADWDRGFQVGAGLHVLRPIIGNTARCWQVSSIRWGLP